ncbi:MAG: ribonuclease III [Pseudomonadota bacterium]
MSDTGRLQQALGYQFSDQELLELALTHRSAGTRNNERLEFLGDAVLNYVIAEALYQQFPHAREGELSRLRASLVRGETLATVASELGLGDCLMLGSGERKSGGQRRTSILADALEAVLGAILLDSDATASRDCVLLWFAARLASVTEDSAGKDPKTRLQEYLQGLGRPLPEYQLVSVEGQDHAQEFHVICRLEEPNIGLEGVGSSRRKAEQQAADAVLTALAGDES